MKDDELNQKASELVNRYDLTSLMISFFFKGGHTHLGCEFVHKSFREYLFAEAIVEALKDFGINDSGELSKHTLYWKDFDKDNPQHRFSKRLAELPSPQWLGPEVVAHLEELLAWEIRRSASEKGPPRIGTTGSISLEQ